MTSDEQTQQRPAVKAPSTLRRVAFWGSLFAACYGLTLFVLLDDWFLLAMPGIIGMFTLGAVAVGAIVSVRPPEPALYATDGSDARGPVAYHRAAVLKRYPLVLAFVGVLVGLVVLVKSDYLIPLAPLAVAGFVFGNGTVIGQLLAANRMARVLKVYRFTHRAPVKVLHRGRGGKQLFRLGAGEQESERLIGMQLGGEKDWGRRVGDHVLFAGDDLFGGVVLVPGSGELVFVQPNDGPALQSQRAAATPERKQMSKRAGIGKGA